MPLPIEDYALIGDCHTAALVGSDGSIDWLCLPRFDSPSVFGALLGEPDHGRWLLAPAAKAESTRSYDGDNFTLVTRWVTAKGEVEVTELMPVGDRRADVIRRVRGIRGTVKMHQDLRIRFDYADAVPWVRQLDGEATHALVAVAGPDAVIIRGPELKPHSDLSHSSDFTVSEGETVDITFTWYPSYRDVPPPLDVSTRVDDTATWWAEWLNHPELPSEYAAEVRRSLLILRALTHEDTGGIVAAATTSLPEQFGGGRNWDYRYVWLRDASLTLDALLRHGYRSVGDGWRGWLLRAIAGDPGDVQIMYGLGGERRLPEWELKHLPGYNDSAPVRIGNGAYTQYQGDVFGEVMLALQHAREVIGTEVGDISWPLQRALMTFVEENWKRPDNGIWEIRGDLKHFTHSRVMLWAAFDCAVRAVEDFGLEGPVARWRALRTEIEKEIEGKGFNKELNSYVQFYGSTEVDASLLVLPHTGYLAADDPRMLGTVAAIEKDLMHEGLLMRYRTDTGVDGLDGSENPFLACSFWLAEQYAASGRLDDAVDLMDRLCGFSNDVGMLSEQYDPIGKRQAGNTPQALSHLALVRTADAIARARQ